MPRVGQAQDAGQEEHWRDGVICLGSSALLDGGLTCYGRVSWLAPRPPF